MKNNAVSKVVFALLLLLFGLQFEFCAKKNKSKNQKYSVTGNYVDQLESRTGILILPKHEEENITAYRHYLTNCWTISNLKIIKESDAHKYGDYSKYYFFKIKCFVYKVYTYSQTTHRTDSDVFTYFYLDLELKPNHSIFRVELYPSYKTLKLKSTDFYQKGIYRNFKVPYMIFYFRFMENNLKKGQYVSVFQGFDDKELKSALKSDTLYIPEKYIHRRNPLKGWEWERRKGIFNAYKGPYRFVNEDQLLKLIDAKKEGEHLFLFEYTLSSTDKYVSVLDVMTGNVVYRRLRNHAYNIKKKDLKKILRD